MTRSPRRRPKDEGGAARQLSPALAALLASALTGAITLVGMEFQIQSQSDQQRTQIEEDRETARTAQRQRQYANFLGDSEALSSAIVSFELDMTSVSKLPLKREVKAVLARTRPLRAQADRLSAQRARLLVLGPSALGFMAWDIADDQRAVISLMQTKYVGEAFDRAVGAGPRGASLKRHIERQLRQTERQLSKDTSNLIAAVLTETSGSLSANPGTLSLLIRRINEEQAKRAAR